MKLVHKSETYLSGLHGQNLRLYYIIAWPLKIYLAICNELCNCEYVHSAASIGILCNKKVLTIDGSIVNCFFLFSLF